MKDGEVLFYETLSVDLHFPEGHVCCKYCPLLETYSRDQCRRTGEYIFNIHATGFDCPLYEKGEMNEQS